MYLWKKVKVCAININVMEIIHLLSLLEKKLNKKSYVHKIYKKSLLMDILDSFNALKKLTSSANSNNSALKIVPLMVIAIIENVIVLKDSVAMIAVENFERKN